MFSSNNVYLTSLRENEAAFDRYKIRPRVLKNVNQIDTSTTVLDTKVCNYSRISWFKTLVVISRKGRTPLRI